MFEILHSSPPKIEALPLNHWSYDKEPPWLLLSESKGLIKRDGDNSDKGFLKEFFPAYLPQPIPSEYLILLCMLVATRYSRVK